MIFRNKNGIVACLKHFNWESKQCLLKKHFNQIKQIVTHIKGCCLMHVNHPFYSYFIFCIWKLFYELLFETATHFIIYAHRQECSIVMRYLFLYAKRLLVTSSNYRNYGFFHIFGFTFMSRTFKYHTFSKNSC